MFMVISFVCASAYACVACEMIHILYVNKMPVCQWICSHLVCVHLHVYEAGNKCLWSAQVWNTHVCPKFSMCMQCVFVCRCVNACIAFHHDLQGHAHRCAGCEVV